MDASTAAALLEALSSDTRLTIFRLLVRHAPQGLVAGDIARTLALPPSNLSFHLKAVAQAGLITAQRQGRFLRYRANIPLMREIIAYLTAASCTDRGQEPVRGESRATAPATQLPQRGRLLW